MNVFMKNRDQYKDRRNQKHGYSSITQFKHVHEGKNPFMKAGDPQSKNKSNPESRNHQATTDFIPNYSSNPSTNRNQTRPSIPFHQPPFRQNRKQRRNYTTPRNSFLGHGPRQNQIT